MKGSIFAVFLTLAFATFANAAPNIDSIATGGVKFLNGYVAWSVCFPSRK